MEYLSSKSCPDREGIMQEGASIFVAAPGQVIGAEVVETDIMTCAGVIHVIDALLLPGT